MDINKILIVPNIDKEGSSDYAAGLREYLTAKGVQVLDQDSLQIPDMAIILGGDGSLLSAAKLPILDCVPLLGINFGNLGYLTECEPGEGFNTIDSILSGKFRIVERMTLSCSLSGSRNDCYNSLNDVIVHRGSDMHTICVNITIDGEPTARIVCDGIIVSTPTGSTAYNLSAGGPVLMPGSDNVAITPICQRGAGFVSFVTKSSADILLCPESVASLGVDGENFGNISPDDTVRITLSPKKVYTVKVGNEGFYSTLRRKLLL